MHGAGRHGSGRRLVLWLAAVGLVAGLAFVPGRAGAADTASYSATRTLTFLPPSAFNRTDPSDDWVLDGQTGTPWVGVARAQVTKYTSNSGACAPTGYRSLQVVSPARTSYSLGLVYAVKDGDPLLGKPVTLDDAGVADLSGVPVVPNGTLPQFLVVLGGGGDAPASVDVTLSWTGLANAACSTVTTAAPTLTVVKHVVGGGASAGRWSLHVKDASGAEVAGSPQAGSETGTTYTLSAGTFTVGETGDLSGYTGAFSGDCDAKGTVTLADGDRKTCTLTNTFATETPPTLTVIKHVVGGGASAGRWSLHVRDASGAEVAGSPQAGSETGTTYTLAAGTFTVAETGDISGYTGAFSGDCDAKGAVTLAAGDKKTCTLTNTAAPTTGTLTVKKIVSGGTAKPSDWQLHVKVAGAGDVAGSPQAGSSTGTDYTLAPGAYAVSESDGPSGYTATYSGDCGETGAVSVEAGAARTCTLTNTFRDTTPPVLHGSGNLTSTATSAAGAVVSYEVTATDPDDPAVTAVCVSSPSGLGSGSTFPIGVTAIHCTASDPAGNAATPLDFTVTVNDAAPFLTVPADITDTTTDVAGKIERFTVSATDYKDGSLPVTCDHNSGDTFPVGKTTVLCSATNSSKLTTMASFTVTIAFDDRTAPTIQSPGDQTATATSKDGARVFFEVAATDPDDASDTLTLTCDHASGDTFPITVTTVTCNAHDPAGNKAVPVSFTVTVNDAAPALSLPAAIHDTTNDPAGKVEPFTVTASSFKDGPLTPTCDHASGENFPVGTTTVHCSATNSSKQTTSGSFAITIDYLDATPPVLKSPGDQKATATSRDGAPVSFIVTATDPDNVASELTIVCGPLQSGDTFPIGVATETCNAHDPAGNRAEAISFTVTVADAPPTLSLPADIKDTTNDQAGKAETFAVTATDFKDGALTPTCDHASGETFPVGTTTVHCSATNSSKMTTSGSFTIAISYRDITPPVLHVPNDVTVAATSPAGAVVSYAVTATDPDDAADTITIACVSSPADLHSGSTFPIGQTVIACTAKDPAGNSATPQSFTVTVNDAPPFVTVPADIHDTATDPKGKVETFTVTATDYKDGPLTPTCDHASGDTFPVGTTTVTCGATNSSKQTSTASFTVTIAYSDVTAPTIQSPGNQTATATSASGAKVSFDVTANDPDDASGTLTVVCDHASGDTFAITVTTVTCNAHDPAGNNAEPVSFTVTVNDAPPTLSLPAAIHDTTNDPAGKVETFTVTASSFKDGPLTPTCDHPSGETFPVGTTTVHCSATNSSKQTTSGSFAVTIAYADVTPPTIQSPGNQTATAASASGAKVSFAVTATDPDDASGTLTVVCDHASGDTFPIATTTVTCNAHDQAGNQAEPVGFTVTVHDAPPALSLPDDIHDVTHNPAGASETFTASASDFKDGSVPVTCDHVSGDSFPVGTTTVHCSATNSSGQKTSGSFTISLDYVDTSAPVIQAVDNQTAIATSKDGAKVTFGVIATDADDASDTLTVVCDHPSGSTFPIATTTVTCNAHDEAGNQAEPVGFAVTVHDAPPALSLPDAIHDVTHNPAGASETFTASASDFKDGRVPVTCDHVSGDSFPVGTSTVHCSATNSSGQKTSGSFTISLDYVDTSAPTIHTSGNQHVAATSADGAAVSYTATADDPDDSAAKLTLACSPLASGATFPVGVTTITCKANDPAGNTAAPATFTVTVDPLPAPAAPSGTANVSLAVSGPALGRVGADVSFSFVVKSSGTAPTTGVEVRAQVPDGATLVSATGAATCTGQTSLVCVFGTVPGGATQTQTIVLRATRAGSLSLFATLSGDGASGSSSASTTVLDVDAAPPAPPTPAQPETFNAISTGTVLVNDVPKPSDTLFLIVSGDHVRLNGLLAITTAAGNSGLFSNVPFGAKGGPPTSFVVTINGTATTLTLEGGDFSICTAPRRTAAADPKTVVRQLWGKAKGSFTTKAKYSSATIRGTTWGVQDRCDGTFSTAVDDFVDVVNFTTKKTITLSPGQTYLATPPRKSSGSFRPPSQSAAKVRAQGLVWAGHRFLTKAQFSAWLSSKGSSWAVFGRQHPALAKALAARRAKP